MIAFTKIGKLSAANYRKKHSKENVALTQQKAVIGMRKRKCGPDARRLTDGAWDGF